MTDQEKKELCFNIAYSLIHNIDICDHCKRCLGNCDEIRLNMIENMIEKLFEEKPFRDGEEE